MKQLFSDRIFKIVLPLCFILLFSSCEKCDIEKKKISVGVFGGSISSYKESEVAKKVWIDNLPINVKTCGIPGAGFSSLTPNNIPQQIERAEAFDVYILWASTNDVVMSTIGDINNKDEKTQSGGIFKSLELIRQKKPNALILFFTSLPRFNDNSIYERISFFVDNQIAICEKENIPYLNQYKLCDFRKDNFSQYFLEDHIHLNENGYYSIAVMQMEFIRKHIYK